MPREEIRAMGMIVPGIYFAGTGEVWAPNLWGHANVPLRAELERELKISVEIDSDRAGYVTGERWLGAARGLKDVVFLAVGTGIGAGIISGGRLVRGAADISGAVGWFALNREYREVYRELGCWEAEAAGPALARRMGASSAEEVVASARKRDAAAKQAVEQSAMYLGMGIANIVSILNPEMIVLGGGLMQAADLFLEPIRRTVAQWAQPVAAKQVRIELTQLGEDAGLLGAARLALGDSDNE
jgi:glucokinase